jgi:uncharacterized Zn finger protein
MGRYDHGGWPAYIPVAKRQHQAKQKVAALNKKGHDCQPVMIEGRAIAKSFWGKAWCSNLGSYSDFANRLPRGRSYARNGSVIDLRIESGQVKALVSGSDVYSVEIGVQPLAAERWRAIVQECAGKVASVIELLQGKLSDTVMETVTRHGDGLFPLPRQISLRCSCPDAATMCKHVAAVLYGVGARLDHQPELLFLLRQVEPQDLIRQAGNLPAMANADSRGAFADTDLSALFGIELDDTAAAPTAQPTATIASPGKRLLQPKAVDPQPSKAAGEGTKVPTPRAGRSKSVTAADLIARGVARHMIQNWLTSGVLLRTEQRGVYRTTPRTEARIVAYTGVSSV